MNFASERLVPFDKSYFFRVTNRAKNSIIDPEEIRITPFDHYFRGNTAHSIDAEGCVVYYGFIDFQSHLLHPYLKDGRGLSKVTQKKIYANLKSDDSPTSASEMLGPDSSGHRDRSGHGHDQ